MEVGCVDQAYRWGREQPPVAASLVGRGSVEVLWTVLDKAAQSCDGINAYDEASNTGLRARLLARNTLLILRHVRIFVVLLPTLRFARKLLSVAVLSAFWEVMPGRICSGARKGHPEL